MSAAFSDRAMGAAFTVTLQTAYRPSGSVAVTTVLPFFLPVILPVEDTAATRSPAELKLTFAPPVSEVTFSLKVSPAPSVTESAFNATALALPPYGMGAAAASGAMIASWPDVRAWSPRPSCASGTGSAASSSRGTASTGAETTGASSSSKGAASASPPIDSVFTGAIRAAAGSRWAVATSASAECADAHRHSAKASANHRLARTRPPPF